jgi:hypothetical protein
MSFACAFVIEVLASGRRCLGTWRPAAGGFQHECKTSSCGGAIEDKVARNKNEPICRDIPHLQVEARCGLQFPAKENKGAKKKELKKAKKIQPNQDPVQQRNTLEIQAAVCVDRPAPFAVHGVAVDPPAFFYRSRSCFYTLAAKED